MEYRIAHFGYSANYGGVEAYIRNINSYVDLPIDLVVTTQGPIPFESEFTQKGGRVYRITPRRKSYFKHYYDLIRLFAKNKDIKAVYVHLNSCSSLAPLKVARLFGRVCIAHSHNSNVSPDWGNSKLITLLHSINIHFLPLLTNYRRACSAQAGSYMFPKQSFQIVANAVDLDKFTYSQEKRNAVRKEFDLTDEFVVGHIGLFSAVKNQSFLVDIFKALHNKIPNSVLMLVGDGPLKKAVEKKAEQLGLKDSVIFTGKRADTDKLLCCMDAFVMPSTVEGLPFTLIEAQACDLPCITSFAITDEAIICRDHFKKLSLESTADSWADEILTSLNYKDRQNRQADIEKAGFSLAEAGKEYEQLYKNIKNYISE